MERRALGSWLLQLDTALQAMQKAMIAIDYDRQSIVYGEESQTLRFAIDARQRRLR